MQGLIHLATVLLLSVAMEVGVAPSAARAQSPRLPKVVSSGAHGLIVLPSGIVKVFGDNNRGQLGLGAVGQPQFSDLVDLPGVYDAVDVATAVQASYVLRADGTVLAWGSNASGRLGLGKPGPLPRRWEILDDVPLPTPIPGLRGVRQIDGHGGTALALMEDGSVFAWGQCGDWKLDGVVRDDKDDGRVTFPARVSGLSGVKAIAAGDRYALALMNDGSVKAWGSNQHGQLGDEVIRASPTPVTVPGLRDIVAVAADYGHALALQRDGTVWVWGSGGNEDLTSFGGTRSPSIHFDTHPPWSAKPIAIPGLRNVVAISARGANAALLANGNVRVWGYDGYCALGLGHCDESRHTIFNARIANVAAVSGGLNDTYFVQRDGSVWAAGGYSVVSFYRPNDVLPLPTVILTREQAMQPAPTDPAPPPPKEDPVKKLNDGLNKLRELKELLGR